MASTLKINTLTGVTTAGSIAVTGEGNSTTTNLQQGLAKCFVRTSEPGTVTDSFNVSSSSDEATGQHRSAYTNNMSGSKNSCTGAGCEGAINTNTILFEATSNESASQLEFITLLLTGTSNHALGDFHVAVTVHGDLA